MQQAPRQNRPHLGLQRAQLGHVPGLQLAQCLHRGGTHSNHLVAQPLQSRARVRCVFGTGDKQRTPAKQCRGPACGEGSDRARTPFHPCLLTPPLLTLCFHCRLTRPCELRRHSSAMPTWPLIMRCGAAASLTACSARPCALRATAHNAAVRACTHGMHTGGLRQARRRWTGCTSPCRMPGQPHARASTHPMEHSATPWLKVDTTKRVSDGCWHSSTPPAWQRMHSIRVTQAALRLSGQPSTVHAPLHARTHARHAPSTTALQGNDAVAVSSQPLPTCCATII